MKTLKIKNLFAGIALSLSLLSPAQAISTARGIIDCGKWVSGSKINPELKAWLLGYMSGLSMMYDQIDESSDPFGKINSAEQLYLWMDNYCQTNPLSNVLVGGSNLFNALKDK